MPNKLPALLFFTEHADPACFRGLNREFKQLRELGYSVYCDELFADMNAYQKIKTLEETAQHAAKLQSLNTTNNLTEGDKSIKNREESLNQELIFTENLMRFGGEFRAIDIPFMQLLEYASAKGEAVNSTTLQNIIFKYTSGETPESQELFALRNQTMTQNLVEATQAGGVIGVFGYRHAQGIQQILKTEHPNVDTLSFYIHSRTPYDQYEKDLRLNENTKQYFPLGVTKINVNTDAFSQTVIADAVRKSSSAPTGTNRVSAQILLKHFFLKELPQGYSRELETQVDNELKQLSR